MTRNRTRVAVIIPRKKIVVFFAIAVAVLAATAVLQWLVITRSSSGTKSEFFPDLPDVDLSMLQPNARDQLVRQANELKCDCNCGLSLACCRNRDRSCQTSLKICRAMVKQAGNGAP